MKTEKQMSFDSQSAIPTTSDPAWRWTILAWIAMIAVTSALAETHTVNMGPALGPTLTDFGLAGAIDDPTLEVFRGNVLAASNDDWKNSSQQAEIQNSGLAPGKDESAIIALLQANQNYTAIVRGKNGQPGIALVDASEMGDAVNRSLRVPHQKVRLEAFSLASYLQTAF
jgi:hypothetical protein